MNAGGSYISPSFEKKVVDQGINMAITTRILAKKLSNTPPVSRARMPSKTSQMKFLKGTQIPNSTRRASMNSNPSQNLIQKKSSLMENRNARRPTLDSISFISRKTKTESEDASGSPPAQDVSNNKTMKRMRKHSTYQTKESATESQPIIDTSRSMLLSQIDIHEREINRRLSAVPSEFIQITLPKRRSTLEEIKEAIDNSEEIRKLMNADSIEKQMQSTTSKTDRDSFTNLIKPILNESKSKVKRRVDSMTQTSTEFEVVKRQLLENAKQRRNSRQYLTTNLNRTNAEFEEVKRQLLENAKLRRNNKQSSTANLNKSKKGTESYL